MNFFHFDISESLHSMIFSNATRWSGFKQLRKIKDYYRADCILNKDDALIFIHELIEVCEINSLNGVDTDKIKILIKGNNVKYLRVSSD